MKFSGLLIIGLLIMLSACAGSANRSADADAVRKQAEVNTALGREYMGRGQYEIALEKLKKATSIDPLYAPAHTVLAVLYEQIGELESAEQHYQHAIDAAPDNGDVNNNYGVFLCQSGRASKAEKYFIRATADPFYRTPAIAYANAGACEIDGGNLDKAERYLRQSLEYDAEFADALLALANVSFLKDDFFRARAFLQRYEGAEAATAESLALGSRIETGLNNEQAARKYNAELMSRFPNSRQAEEIRANESRDNS